MWRALLLALTLSSLTSQALADTAADRFAPKRGFSTDIWVTWQAQDAMIASPDFLTVYPDYPRHMPPDTLARLQAQGFDTIRIAADPSPLLVLADTPREAPLLDNLRQRVVEAQAAGLKVILDLHTYPHAGETGDIDGILANESRFAAYLTVVAKVGNTIADLDPDRTAFEVMNEPTQDCAAIYSTPATSTWPTKLARLQAAARTAVPALPLVLSGACWGGSKGLSVLDPAALHDDNVIWSFHTYDPFTFTHQGASWTDSPLVYVHNLPFPPDRLTDAQADALLKSAQSGAPAALKAPLRQIIRDYRHSPPDALTAAITEATLWADAHNIPRHRLFLGEFGALWQDDSGHQIDPDSHARFLTAKRQAAEAAGIGWAVWSFSGSFAITAPDARLYPIVCTALGLSDC